MALGYHEDSVTEVQIAFSTGVTTLAVLVGILIHNARLSDFRRHMNRRFDDMERRFDEMKDSGVLICIASSRFSVRG